MSKALTKIPGGQALAVINAATKVVQALDAGIAYLESLEVTKRMRMGLVTMVRRDEIALERLRERLCHQREHLHLQVREYDAHRDAVMSVLKDISTMIRRYIAIHERAVARGGTGDYLRSIETALIRLIQEYSRVCDKLQLAPLSLIAERAGG